MGSQCSLRERYVRSVAPLSQSRRMSQLNFLVMAAAYSSSSWGNGTTADFGKLGRKNTRDCFGQKKTKRGQKRQKSDKKSRNHSAGRLTRGIDSIRFDSIRSDPISGFRRNAAIQMPVTTSHLPLLLGFPRKNSGTGPGEPFFFSVIFSMSVGGRRPLDSTGSFLSLRHGLTEVLRLSGSKVVERFRKIASTTTSTRVVVLATSCARNAYSYTSY